MKQILYTSVETQPIDEAGLGSLLDRARTNNAIRNVTGMLVYADGHFLQALEGAPVDVDSIFAKIAADSRHRDVHVFLDHAIPTRTFSDWSMGFARKNIGEIAEKTGAVNLNNLSDIYRHVNDALVLDLMVGFVNLD